MEEYKDFSLSEMKPCLDVLFHAYDYEKEQIGIVDTISGEEYENLVKEFKLKRSMALKIKTELQLQLLRQPVLYSKTKLLKQLQTK